MPGPGELLPAPTTPGEIFVRHSGALAVSQAVTGPSPDPTVIAARLHLGGVVRGETIQFDVMQAWVPERSSRSLPLITNTPAQEASRCNLNCQEKYHCPAAFSLNPGLDPNSLAPAEVLVESVSQLAEAALEARSRFFAPGGGFEDYCQRMDIPTQVANVLRREELAKQALINLFGGNPEAHKELIQVIQQLRGKYEVRLTTTGGQLVISDHFYDQLREKPPASIALSADDFDGPEDIQTLAGLRNDELKQLYKTTNAARHSHRKKAIGAIWVARHAAELPPLRFNMVLHAGNIDNALPIAQELGTHFPGVEINAYPAQSAFEGTDPVLQAQHLRAMRAFINEMVTIQTETVRTGVYPDRPDRYVMNLPFWLLLQAGLDYADARTDLIPQAKTDLAMQLLAGYETWQCYRQPEVGGCVQAGAGPPGLVRQSPEQVAGLHPGCFWNRDTITRAEQIPAMAAGELVDYISSGRQQLAAASEARGTRCPGCLFPTLLGGGKSIEAGMAPQIKPFYLQRRRQTLGY